MQLRFKQSAENFRFLTFNSKPPETLTSIEGAFSIMVASDYSIMLPVSKSNVDIARQTYEVSKISWCCLTLMGEFAFDTVGVAALVTGILAQESVSVLVMSGFKTDYFFMSEQDVNVSIKALSRAGHQVIT
ncbi:MAG: ACT domain-containing protein [Gammaproteobacteria bacterium]|jgi:hypothetical protein|nr:ACT domain-containing protein [Gammaproteobacteria bacterium]MBT5204727.1 ACT domain-containing protein [Gammaproteobacteria bacterium]MBT5601679.1 ACT domain-containing protein [Gammaproteobacteria bacterium]MBT6245258.1 ACT domain-containing protein [Gammaproteobacteria bacterium]MBT7452204.1 ACT domain-containing protein [Rhodospirillaceae bacterium]